jgi:serine/threonine protein kinase
MARAEARVGSVLRGKYRIDKVLGAGGMAIVYEVTHRNQKRFALKMLHAELSVHEDIRRRFLREGYAANIVDHPGAVVVIDDDTAEDGAAFLVMELLDGVPLDELLSRNERRLPAEAVLAVAEQALDVLAVAHEKGIVHRDIKPANLFALRDGTVKMLDFGIARLRDASAASSQATHTGVMLGTPAYMPPEQALSQASQIDAQTDLWAIGATMFTLLSGANVHQGQNATQILVAAASQKARSVKSVAPWVDDRVAALVAKGVAFQKSDRFASAAEMREGVRKVHEEVHGSLPARSAIAALVGPGQRKAANPDPFIVSESSPGASARATKEAGPALTVGGTVEKGGPISSPLAESVAPALGGSSVAFSTAKPVSGGGAPAAPTVGAPRGGAQWIALAIVLFGAGALVAAIRSSGGKAATKSGSTATTMSVPSTSPPEPTPTGAPTPPPSASPAAAPTPAPIAAPAPSSAPTPTPTVAPARSVAPRASASAPAPRPAVSARRATSDDDLFHP